MQRFSFLVVSYKAIYISNFELLPYKKNKDRERNVMLSFFTMAIKNIKKKSTY